mmetsp:Transcript_23693/g.69351  ORF Transcript_23693/g.69351 Transcript_23693/m.69351 type:complete len:159 (-) Transcript_23693:142-618(-)|eukprot:CAMPEP_0118962828 /NCGR_PEP_ID=MMETSP1173-20130426/1019_1 /TAXON_ID=1034831 /ORGANISM="Rhizochromulina marina cf, Strain CCMP1243" /LENGTH=158 /DNA_ID=CAMNT_0006911131 /DNA_START=238 /DNA_END=714 /DNA_ORIENTATION=-
MTPLVVVWSTIVLVEVLCKWVLDRFSRPGRKETELLAKVQDLRSQIRQSRSPEHFVLCSRLERDKIEVEKTLSKKQGEREEQHRRLERYPRDGKRIIFGLLVLLYWSTPIFEFRPGVLWPLGFLFAFPTVSTGEVSVHVAVFLIQQGMSQILAATGTW